MKNLIKLILIPVMLTMYSYVQAESYASLYSSTELSSKSSTGNEVAHKKVLAAMLFGLRTNGNIGLSSEFLFNTSGFGLTVGGFAKSGNFTLLGGVIAMPDNSRGNVDGFKSDGSNSQTSDGLYIGLGYKAFSVRLIRYDVTHNYRTKEITGYQGSHHNLTPIYKTGRSTDSVTRDILWLGINLPF